MRESTQVPSPDPELGAVLEEASGALAAELERAQYADDARFHLRSLAQAVAIGAPELFADYLAWEVPMLASRGIPRARLRADIEALRALLLERFPYARRTLEAVMAAALERVDAASEEVMLTPLSPAAEAYFNAAQKQGPIEARQVIDELAADGMPVTQIYVEVLAPAMQRAGELWQANQLSVAEEHYFSAVTQRVIARLFSDLVQGRGRGPTVVVACVAGELHELGARMVCDLLELEGYGTHYLGASMPPRAIVDFACLRGARVLALSVSMTPHLGALREAITHLRTNARCPEMKVLVGGSAFSVRPSLWQWIGADGWAADAASAIAEVRRLTA